MHFNKKTFCGLLLALFLNLQNPMNRLKKILKISGIVLLSLILILSVAPFLFKGKILAAMKKTTNEQLNAKVDFSNDIHLSFLRNFPNVSLGIEQFCRRYSRILSGTQAQIGCNVSAQRGRNQY